ncbi:MAG: Gfo/Idh/MocA family oxidoreductase [Lentisphaerae bacterium]|nr:Gfo/Idh/MocA family oxidoreductase [Lentisphaerota bacterium]MBQ9804524.1 Gfo/Idh/MocA family oxidoreductase [Lentisphaeria bacterium]
MSDKVRFGIIGVGGIGAGHVVRIESLKNAELVAVCDIDPAAFDRIDSKTRERIFCTTELEEFLNFPGLEAVIVAVPHYDHPDLAIAAMEHGKHVIVEKPIAVHKAEAERLIAAAKKYPDLVKSAMFNQRTRNIHRKIKQLIDSGELGTIRRVNWTITNWFRTQLYYDSGDWRATWSGEGGGVLLNQCPHQLDLMQWLFGMPEEVTAYAAIGKYHDIEVEDDVNAFLKYPDGKTGNFIASTGETPGTNRLEIMADRGRVVLENGKIEFIRNEIPADEFCKTSTSRFGTAQTWVCAVNCAADPMQEHTAIINNVAETIRGRAKLIAPMEEGINGLELGNAMLMSGLTGETVKLPLDSAKYAEMLNKLIAESQKRPAKKITKTVDEDFSASYRV